ncbi:MAG: spore coat protein GerQ [Erysipelotrichaceae bacterium]|nr:spore coat protein GerQ [Erysipelotrichaceae bacterium]
MNTYNYNPYNDDYLTRQTVVPNQSNMPGIIDNQDEALYAENVLTKNKGKRIRVYMSFDDSVEWRDKLFEGTIEEMGKDFILIRDNENKWYMLWNIYIDYIEFLSPVNF